MPGQLYRQVSQAAASSLSISSIRQQSEKLNAHAKEQEKDPALFVNAPYAGQERSADFSVQQKLFMAC